jgi:hypothetical protein
VTNGLILNALANTIIGLVIICVVWRSGQHTHIFWSLLLWIVGVLAFTTGIAALVLVMMQVPSLGH